MAELPSGTVTFLLTDVEGSTALWEEAPEAMRMALAQHDLLFEEEIHAHGGTPIKPRGEGDSHFAVFTGASGAVVAALALQRTLADTCWSTPRPIKVRIGIHTGEAQLRDGDYYGPAVNRCARLRAIGHGGQTLLSEPTATLVRDDLPDSAILLDLGIHRLKDLTRPERVFQLVASGLVSDFPPLVSLDARPHNLPVQTTSLVGRDQEAARIRALLLLDDLRLLTLTGPGGSGKTRLAIHVGADLLDHFEDGVFFVDLAPLSDPSLVVSTIASVLGLANTGERLLDDVKRLLQARSLLVVLDNFEQILAGASVVVELLTSSTQSKVLVTSRAPLQVRGEHELQVPPLEAPTLASITHRVPSAEDLQRYPAVALFVERAQAVRSDFTLSDENATAVADICRRLDGLPLAIELAAARIRLLPPEAMLRRLDRRLPLLTGGARDLPARQQTLRDTIAWSYEHLDDAERRVFRRLAVFVGGFSLEAAEAVCADDGEPEADVLEGVESLVAKSLLRQTAGSDVEPRFTMLETIREYALEQLEASGEAADVRRRHAEYFIRFAEDAEPRIRRASDSEWFDRVHADHDNIRAALAWADATAESRYLIARLANPLWQFWWMRGHWPEARGWYGRALQLDVEPSARLGALRGLGQLAVQAGDYVRSAALWDEAVAIARATGDLPELAHALGRRAYTAALTGDAELAEALADEGLAIARETGDLEHVAMAWNDVGHAARARGDDGRARRAYEKALHLAREAGLGFYVPYALAMLAEVALDQEDPVRAAALAEEALPRLVYLRVGGDGLQPHRRGCLADRSRCPLPPPGWLQKGLRSAGRPLEE
jgi:predicted ATPase/class 3 adenylate cyclase